MLASIREERVRAQSDLEHQQVSLDELAIRVRETLDCTLDAVLKVGEVEDGEEFPELPQVESRLERSEEHTSELQSLMRISYAVFCLKKKKNTSRTHKINNQR